MDLNDKVAQWYQGAAQQSGTTTVKDAEASAHKQFLKGLEELEPQTLDLFYTRVVRGGANKAWLVDLSNEAINRQCGLPWTWTVATRRMLEGTEITPRPWLIVIGNCSFSLPVLESIVNGWAKEHGFRFDVRIKKLSS